MSEMKRNRLVHRWHIIGEEVDLCAMSLRTAKAWVKKLKSEKPERKLYCLYSRSVFCEIEGTDSLYHAH